MAESTYKESQRPFVRRMRDDLQNAMYELSCAEFAAEPETAEHYFQKIEVSLGKVREAMEAVRKIP